MTKQRVGRDWRVWDACTDRGGRDPSGGKLPLTVDNFVQPTRKWKFSKFDRHARLCPLKNAPPMQNPLASQFGNIDIYLFDQLLRGNITPGMTVLDCGCGSGRNLVYLLQHGFDVCAVDAERSAIDAVQQMAKELAPTLPAQNFRVEPVESMSFVGTSVDVVISNAVLHFARDENQFRAMVREMWRVLRPGGLLFCRLASDIGMEGRFRRLENHVCELLDGSVRFLVDATLLEEITRELGGDLVDPIKTTIVHAQRCMTTWVVRKSAKTSTVLRAALATPTAEESHSTAYNLRSGCNDPPCPARGPTPCSHA